MNLIETLSEKTLLADGAMGTMLHARGVGFDKSFDELNLTNPAAVAEIHRAYIEAGAELIITNTFSANRFKLTKHGLQDDLIEINRAGVELAKRVVAASYKDVLRSEEHTSELQSQSNLVCRLLLEKKKIY